MRGTRTSQLRSRTARGLRPSWLPLTTGNALAGPLALSDGTVTVAMDGGLSRFVQDVATPLEDSDLVIGLNEFDGHRCAHPALCERRLERHLPDAQRTCRA